MKNIKQRYCIYSNSYFEKAGKERNDKDHIIPLSLGGNNNFVVDAEKNFNSKFSNEVEGKLANDFLIQMNRNYFGLRGHAKKDVMPERDGKIEGGGKVKIEFNKAAKKITIKDIRSKQKVIDWGKLSFSLNYKDSYFELFLRFAAKVALGTGYFLYEDFFVKNVAHDELRLIMNGLSKLNEKERRKIKTRGYLGRWFSPKKDTETKEYKLYSEICKSVQGSVVIIYPTTKSLCFHIGIASEYVGMINVPAKTDMLLEKYKDGLGHVILITKNGFKQGSLKSIFNHLSAELLKKET